MADRKQTFTPEFRAEAVRLAQTSGRFRREVAADLGVGLSTRQREGLVLLARVRSVFRLSHEIYGSPRMTYELREHGLAAGRRRVAPLMRENGRSFEAVEYATLEWVDRYNDRRLLAPIGNVPPAEAEARYHTHLGDQAVAA